MRNVIDAMAQAWGAYLSKHLYVHEGALEASRSPIFRQHSAVRVGVSLSMLSLGMLGASRNTPRLLAIVVPRCDALLAVFSLVVGSRARVSHVVTP